MVLNKLLCNKLFYNKLIKETLISNKNLNSIKFLSCSTNNLHKPVELSYFKFDSKNKDNSEKNPILIYHGLFGSKNNWRSLARIISEKTNRDTYVLDVRNHGDSPHTDEFNYDSIVNDAVFFMKNNNFEKAVMLGHSLGGRAFSKLSIEFPNLVEKLIIVDVHPTHQIPANEYLSKKFCNILKSATDDLRNNENKLSLSSARKFLDERLKTQIPDNFLRQFFLSSLCERNDQVDWKFNFDVLTDFLISKLNQITVDGEFKGSTLLVYGGSSSYFGPEHFESVLELMPNTIFECIEGANHYLHISHYEQFIKIIVPFICEN